MKVQGLVLWHQNISISNYLLADLFAAFPTSLGVRVTKAAKSAAAITNADASAATLEVEAKNAPVAEDATKRNPAESASEKKPATAKGASGEQGQLGQPAKKRSPKKVGVASREVTVTRRER